MFAAALTIGAKRCALSKRRAPHKRGVEHKCRGACERFCSPRRLRRTCLLRPGAVVDDAGHAETAVRGVGCAAEGFLVREARPRLVRPQDVPQGQGVGERLDASVSSWPSLFT